MADSGINDPRSGCAKLHQPGVGARIRRLPVSATSLRGGFFDAERAQKLEDDVVPTLGFDRDRASCIVTELGMVDQDEGKLAASVTTLTKRFRAVSVLGV